MRLKDDSLFILIREINSSSKETNSERYIIPTSYEEYHKKQILKEGNSRSLFKTKPFKASLAVHNTSANQRIFEINRYKKLTNQKIIDDIRMMPWRHI